MLLADDAGWNDFSFTRGLLAPESELVGPQAKTPALDALARDGVILRPHGYVACMNAPIEDHSLTSVERLEHGGIAVGLITPQMFHRQHVDGEVLAPR